MRFCLYKTYIFQNFYFPYKLPILLFNMGGIEKIRSQSTVECGGYGCEGSPSEEHSAQEE